MSEKCQTLVAEGDAIQQDPIAQQHELLVSEIESTDGHLGTALRFVVLTVVVINLPNLVFSFRLFIIRVPVVGIIHAWVAVSPSFSVRAF